VTIDELITAIRVTLGEIEVTVCAAADRNGDGMVTVEELVAGVAAALGSCA